MVKWRGFPSEQNTWEPEENMINCDDIMDDFLIKQGILASGWDYSSGSSYRSLPSSSKSKNKFPFKATILDDEDEEDKESNTNFKLIDSSNEQHKRKKQKTERIIEVSIPVESKRFPSSFSIASSIDTSPQQSFKGTTTSSPMMSSGREAQRSIELFQASLLNIEGPPIRVINEIDDVGLPKDFIYIDECIYSEGIPVQDKDFLIGCQCFTCDTSDFCMCAENNNEGILPYTPDGLLANFSRKSAIFECNDRCFCGPSCQSRVVQKGRKIQMDIVRMSEGKGWGAVSREFIPKGSFVAQYTGEIITNIEATKRTKKYGPERMYLFDLDYNYENGYECEFTIDALKCGNISHFFNHSCEPNLLVRAVLINNLDPRMHLVAFFASRDILPNEEVTFDYMGQRDGVTNESFRSTTNAILKRPKIKCLCGTKSCRKYVYL